jgi:hypothetical protein
MPGIEEFKADLKRLESKQIVRRHLLTGLAYLLDQEREFEIKDRTADCFRVEYSEVALVGSAKLGFSIAPNKRYRPFGETSDIDVAVISERLFKTVWEEAYLYKKSRAFWPSCDDFFRYLSRGWVRPDMLPNASTFQFSKTWWDYFNNLTSSQEFGPYKVRGGLYQSWFFFFEYQYKCIDLCISESH